MDWIADYSFAHDSLSGELLASIGASGAIGYVSDNPRKNLTAANLSDLLANGLQVGLVFENNTDDMIGGWDSGHRHGTTSVTQAGLIGYDWHNCVIFAADDRNTGPENWPEALAYMDGFAVDVPWPGYYGDQDSIDYLFARRPHWFYWQTNALGWGNGPSRNAHLVQHYNDPRARGLALDVNDIQREGVPFMAGDGFTQKDRDTLNAIYSQITAPSGFLARLGVNLQKTQDRIVTAEHEDVAVQLAALVDTIKAIGLPVGGVDDPHAFADDVAAEFARRLGVAPPA